MLVPPGKCEGGGRCEPVQITRKDCDTFDVRVETVTTTKHGTEYFDGHVKLRCDSRRRPERPERPERSAGLITADVTFASCTAETR